MDQPTQSYRNRLLQLLPRSDFDALRPHLKAVTLEYRQPLFEANQPLRSVYFPVTGVASLVNTMADGSASEVGTIGNEGIVGLPILLGDELTPMSAYVQVPGAGLHLRAEILRSALQHSAGMRTVMLHYAHAFFDQVAQSAACNHFHPIEQRCCRWLLMTHDRVQSDQFLLTQEFLGMMLGVQRTGVTLAARKLKGDGLIDYHRGQVSILDRKKLEGRACECYAVSKREFDRLLGPPTGSHA
ncbi:Crp/Fnr family transcriptional regulator [Bradyrhizobium sp. Ash2021]|uniref:Crp/Fnr family transcriptional regulator n=1 Tax=Bradyrhizobium sp. Ash2021 TaxID=2954771 RepID=UPI0028168338|nr:Crp/Fnr family transcriptional regulator [Bradyrhizobium sp. Ash2021]WMT77158.1 Crp/Fnr family transcriptional regulator [Bradyrhizobium sp. Ash2021]